MRIILFLAFALVFVRPVFAVEPVDGLAYSDRWLRLLYYEGHDQHFRSVVRDAFFFLSPQGADDPRAELVESIRAFTQTLPVSEVHPQCRFPSRFRFLRQYFKLGPEVVCPQFTQWKSQYEPTELVLVYASQYLSNPASVFGHSFLLAPSKRQIQSFWLTYNFAANIPENANAFGYIVGGLTGWYKGDYSVMPFYNRMFQYGSVENRDLWLYKIKLTPEELDFFLAHMWELVHASHFTYYFMTENCAGILLRTFAATLPDMANTRRATFYAHPMEVVKALEKAGRIASADLIPSQENTLKGILDHLSSQQERTFYQAVRHPSAEVNKVDVRVAEALIQFTAFQTIKNGGDLPSQYKPLERNSLIRRSQFMDPPITFDKTEALKQSPSLSHDSSMVQAGGGTLNGSEVFNFGYRFAIHDVLDADAGYLRNSGIEFLNFKLSVSRDRIWMEELNFVSVDNFQPLSSFDPKASWRVKLAVRENLLTPSLTDQFVQGRGSYGLTLDYKQQYFYALLTGDLNGGHDLPQSRLELGPEVGTILNFRPVKAFISLGAGQGVMDGYRTLYHRASGGLSWNIRRNLSLVQQSEWVRLPVQDLEGYRLNLGARFYY